MSTERLNKQGRILSRIAELVSEGKTFAVATVVSATEGSPGKSGAKMIIFPDGLSEFTVGGGNLENITVKKALEAIGHSRNMSFSLELQPDKNGKMLCGGEAEIFIEVFAETDRVVIFGGGHIALALSGILDILQMPYVVIDNRKEYCGKERFPGAEKTFVEEYSRAAEKADIKSGSYCIIVTQGHRGDKDVLRGLLETEAAYIGMIGSRAKVPVIFRELEEEGIEIDYSRIYSPVGLDLGGDSPAEIAVSIIAEILKVKYGRTGSHMKQITERK